jgi:hypothetical protein
MDCDVSRMGTTTRRSRISTTFDSISRPNFTEPSSRFHYGRTSGKRHCQGRLGLFPTTRFGLQHQQYYYNTNSTTLNLMRSETANAFVLPNNHIFVMTGLFQFARDEDELAAVLGHEMAHNLACLVGEKVWGNAIVRIVANLMLLIDPSGVLFSVFLPTASLLRELLPHSRIQEKETEADQIGMHLAAQACYDPPNGAMGLSTNESWQQHCRSTASGILDDPSQS